MCEISFLFLHVIFGIRNYINTPQKLPRNHLTDQHS